MNPWDPVRGEYRGVHLDRTEACVRIHVPIDSSALSLGAEKVARTIAIEAAKRGIAVELVRNGSRGAFWLEPMIEVQTPAGRMAYGPVQPKDVAALFDAGFTAGGSHALSLGLDRRHPVPEGPGATDQRAHRHHRPAEPGRLHRARRLRRPEERAGDERRRQVVGEVTDSGLRGRGGAAFPTGIKWNTVLGATADRKYIVCNADEGDSGTFSDRMIMEGDPYCLIEGMTIAGIAVGATQGYIYLRSEYPHAFATLKEAIVRARAAGWLGQDVRGSGKAFELEVRLGAGAYICGEETSLLESLEGKRGIVRFKPPLPALRRPVRQADRHQQRHLPGIVHPSSWQRAARSTATSEWAARAAPCPSSSPATSSVAVWSRKPSA
jgi:formate dehydrogenase iron-sulfur subunit